MRVPPRCRVLCRPPPRGCSSPPAPRQDERRPLGSLVPEVCSGSTACGGGGTVLVRGVERAGRVGETRLFDDTFVHGEANNATEEATKEATKGGEEEAKEDRREPQRGRHDGGQGGGHGGGRGGHGGDDPLGIHPLSSWPDPGPDRLELIARSTSFNLVDLRQAGSPELSHASLTPLSRLYIPPSPSLIFAPDRCRVP